MQNSHLYVVPAKDDKGQPQYFVHLFNSEEEALKKVRLIARSHGWEATGSAVEANDKFQLAMNPAVQRGNP